MYFLRRYFRLIFIVVVLALLGLVFWVGRVSVYQSHPELTQTEQANDILVKVGKLIQLPAGETPTMATINDAASAKAAQPFLVNAQNGDVLIVYSGAAQAILYRPSTDKLIAVGPVDTSGAATPKATVKAPTVETPATSTATTTKKK